MSSTAPIDRTQRLRADTLVSSVAILMVVSLVQRSVGFGRSVLFCRWMDPMSVGLWEMAYSFILLAAPLAVLGVPGSFGRYVEHYRRQGKLRTFLRRTAVWTLVFGACASGLVFAAAPRFSQLIFGSRTQVQLVLLIGAAMATVILHHFLEALLTGLRMFRVVSIMHFTQSLSFAVISLSLLAWWQIDATCVVVGYAAACFLSATGVLFWLRPALSQLPREVGTDPITHGSFWPKLLRFAFWIWLTNLLANLFAVVDRYMIVHYGGFSGDEALQQVGHYHSSRIIPLLLLSVADLLSSIVLPHLTHDWEAGRRTTVSNRLNLVLKLTAMAMFVGSVCVLIVAPLLFQVAFEGKYDGGLAVLPWALTYCALNGLVVVAMTYLWCAERTGLSTLPMGVALIANMLLNVILLPRLGLLGAVIGTTAANVVCLALTFWLNRRVGMRFDFRTLLLSGLPLFLVGGSQVALVVLVCAAVGVAYRNTLFTEWEKTQCRHLIKQVVRRANVTLRRPRRSTPVP